MRIALIISYYERPDLLALCLRSVAMQTRKPDQIILLDDGSNAAPFKAPLFVYDSPMFHENDALVTYNTPPIVDLLIWQPHAGFGKQHLLNKAILETDCDYLIVIDQDIIIPPHFVETHERIAERDRYVCAMYTSLTKEETALTVTPERISNCEIWWIIPRGYEGSPHIWCGAGSAVWKEDALRINGFDTRFGWCGGDFNFGLRLAPLAWKHFSQYGRYFHLWHEKPWAGDMQDYRSGDRLTANRLAREWAQQAVTPYGIAQQDMSKFEIYRAPKGTTDVNFQEVGYGRSG